MAFYSGQKIVCIDDGPDKLWRRLDLGIRRGVVYTVLRPTYEKTYDLHGVLLIEIPPIPPCYLGWHESRFRALADTKTDISQLEGLLNIKTIKELIK